MLPGTLFTLADKVEGIALFPEQASSFAETNDWLFGWITLICIGFFVPMMAFMLYCMVKYRKPKGGKAESDVSHHTPIELLWSIGPSFFLVIMFVMGARAYLDIRTPPEGSYEVGVQAKKWVWLMDYGRGTKSPELHLVVNEPTKLVMQSADVIHSLYIPAFRAKKDIVPGRYNYMWFKPTKVSEKVSDEDLADAKKWTKASGNDWDYEKYQFTPQGYKYYDLYCTEYCGKDHSKMKSVVVVHENQEDLDAWIAEVGVRGSVSMVEWGKKLYAERGCKSCHSLDGSKMTGPSYMDSYGAERSLTSGDNVLFDASYVRESIINPKAKIAAGYAPVMPSFKGQLSDDDIASLTEFIKTLSKNTPKEELAAEGGKDNKSGQGGTDSTDAEKKPAEEEAAE